MTVQLLGLSGSLRAGSHNRALLRAAARVAGPGIDVSVFEGEKAVPVLDEDLEATPPAGVSRLRDAVEAASGVLIATPEYNQSLAGSTKNLIDWLSRSDHLDGKPVAVVGATPGPWGTRIAQTQLRHILLSVGALVMPAPMLFVAEAGRLVDDRGEFTDERTLRRLAGVVDGLAAWTELHTTDEAHLARA